MRVTLITFPWTLKMSEEFFASLPKEETKPQRGRPKKYSDAFILAIRVYQQARRYSIREVLEEVESLGWEVPVPSNYIYRVDKLGVQLVERFVAYLGEKLRQVMNIRFSWYGAIDGTGFSYESLYPLNFYRGKEVRYVSSHVRAVVLVGIHGKRVAYIAAVALGKAYASEVKLAERMIRECKERGMPIKIRRLLGDGVYDCIRLMEELESLGIKPVIRLGEENLYEKAKHPVRKASGQRASNWKVYKKRKLIEGLFGEIKQKHTSHVYDVIEKRAQIDAGLRFAVWNLYRLIVEEKKARKKRSGSAGSNRDEMKNNCFIFYTFYIFATVTHLAISQPLFAESREFLDHPHSLKSTDQPLSERAQARNTPLQTILRTHGKGRKRVDTYCVGG